VALNLAIAARSILKIKVIAAEMRPGQGSWGDELGLADLSGLVRLLQMNRPEITPAIVEKQLTPNVFGVPLLLAPNTAGDLHLINALTQFEAVVQELSLLAELVVLDIGTSFHPAYEVLIELCDEIILVTEPQPLTVKRTRTLLQQLKGRDFGSAKPLTLITVNRMRSEMSMPASQIEEALGQTVALGFPPAPELAYQAASRSTPFYTLQPQGIITKQFEVLAKSIGQHVAGATT
jgi:Flp pilus assembly CpaE family ATPase